MISKFIKKLFGKKDELRKSTREEKMFNLDLMMDKIFIYHESAYALIEKGRYEEAKNAPVLWAKYWSTLGRVPEYFR